MSKIKKKLFEIKKAVRHIKPDKKGFGYDYASPSKVLGVFNPLFEEHNILLTCTITGTEITSVDSTKGQKLKGDETLKFSSDIIHTVHMEFIFTDVDSGEELAVKWAGVGSNGSEQGFGSALTYGERYFLLKYFGIPVDKDDPNQIRTPQPKKTLKKMTAKEKEGFLKAIERGNKGVVQTLMANYEDTPMKEEILKKL